MGSWFSNLHIRKNSVLTEATVTDYIREMMSKRQYEPVASEEEADGAFAIVTDDRSQWYSVYSDQFSFDEPGQFTHLGTAMSKALQTDVLGLACFDSDLLILNLIDAANQVDAGAFVGFVPDLDSPEQADLSEWKDKVSDFEHFRESLQQDYVFAEDVLGEIENCIHLPQEHGAAAYDYLDDTGLNEQATYLYFKLSKEEAPLEPPQLMQLNNSLSPYYLGQPAVIRAINMGGASKGLSVYFIGSYVEKEEITFSEVSWVVWKKDRPEYIPIALQKIQLKNGQWAYHYHDPEYPIPEKVDEHLPPAKHQRVMFERRIGVRFIPQGNPRKILDISVVFVPDQNPQGQTGWNVWCQYGSKQAYIEAYNAQQSRFQMNPDTLLKAEDYD